MKCAMCGDQIDVANLRVGVSNGGDVVCWSCYKTKAKIPLRPLLFVFVICGLIAWVPVLGGDRKSVV